MKDIFAVSRGEYSDYSVLCVCDSEATANRIADAYNASSGWSTARVEPMLLVTEDDKLERMERWQAEAVLHDDGNVTQQRTWPCRSWNFETDGIGRPPERPQINYHRAPVLRDEAGFLRVAGKSEQEVLKVLGERIAAFKARSWVPVA